MVYELAGEKPSSTEIAAPKSSRPHRGKESIMRAQNLILFIVLILATIACNLSAPAEAPAPPIEAEIETALPIKAEIETAPVTACLPTLPDEKPEKNSYETIVEEFDILAPSGNRLYGMIRRPDPSQYPDLCFPGVVLVPGGINPGRLMALGQEAKVLAGAGMVVATFNAEGRADSSPEDTRSEGTEDYNGYRHQDGLCAIVQYVMNLPYVISDNVGIASQSYGITMAAGCVARHPEIPIKYLVDGEGPPYSFVTCHGPRSLAGDVQKYETVGDIFGRQATWQDDSPENLEWWAEREAINFIGDFRGYYLRLQATWDHAQPPESEAEIASYTHPNGWPGGGPAWYHNKHTSDIVNAAVEGGVPWVRVNLVEQSNPVNAAYNFQNQPVYLPGRLADRPWAVFAILEMVRME
jgi:hypothetical protein